MIFDFVIQSHHQPQPGFPGHNLFQTLWPDAGDASRAATGRFLLVIRIAHQEVPLQFGRVVDEGQVGAVAGVNDRVPRLKVSLQIPGRFAHRRFGVNGVSVRVVQAEAHHSQAGND